jgi:hypothetical protein
MKRILLCGVMLGLMAGVGFAQRGRAAGGAGSAAGAVGPSARMPGNAPMARTAPNAVTNAQGSMAPDAVSGSATKTVKPNGTSGANSTVAAPNAGNATTVSPNANTVPDRAMNPDAQGISDHTRTNPNQ